MDTCKLKSIEEYFLKLDETLSELKYDRNSLQSILPSVVTKIQILSTNCFISKDPVIKTKLSQLELKARQDLEKIEQLLAKK